MLFIVLLKNQGLCFLESCFYMWDVSVHHRETGTISKFSAQNFRTHFDLIFTGPKQARPPMGLGILLAQMAPCERLNWPTAV